MAHEIIALRGNGFLMKENFETPKCLLLLHTSSPIELHTRYVLFLAKPILQKCTQMELVFIRYQKTLSEEYM